MRSNACSIERMFDSSHFQCRTLTRMPTHYPTYLSVSCPFFYFFFSAPIFNRVIPFPSRTRTRPPPKPTQQCTSENTELHGCFVAHKNPVYYGAMCGFVLCVDNAMFNEEYAFDATIVNRIRINESQSFNRFIFVVFGNVFNPYHAKIG